MGWWDDTYGDDEAYVDSMLAKMGPRNLLNGHYEYGALKCGCCGEFKKKKDFTPGLPTVFG